MDVVFLFFLMGILQSVHLNVLFRPLWNANSLAFGNCDFEKECTGYEHDDSVTFYWRLGRRATPSKHTGPNTDHTPAMNGFGHYLYIESSNSQLNGDVARFQTKLLSNRLRDNICVRFFYHMDGHTMGELSVIVKVSGAESTMFSLKGRQTTNSEWLPGQFSFQTPNQPFKVIFQAKTSYSRYGDMAIDDITITTIKGYGCSNWPLKSANASPDFTFRQSSYGPENSKTCGRSIFNKHVAKSGHVARINSGNEAKHGEWPWMAMMLVKKESGNFQHWCGGTLLATDWVITAAHCVVDIPFSTNIMVRLGAHDRVKPSVRSQDRFVESVYVHPNYKLDKKYNNDVALIKLSRPAIITKYVESICLLDKHQFSGSEQCFIAGWGKLWNDDGNETAPYSIALNEGEITLRGKDNCKELYGNRITSSMLCAGENHGIPDTCFGDSGGPLMCKKNNQWLLTGITSWGHSQGCGIAHKYGVYTDVKSIQAWLKSVAKYPDSHKKLHG